MPGGRADHPLTRNRLESFVAPCGTSSAHSWQASPPALGGSPSSAAARSPHTPRRFAPRRSAASSGANSAPCRVDDAVRLSRSRRGCGRHGQHPPGAGAGQFPLEGDDVRITGSMILLSNADGERRGGSFPTAIGWWYCGVTAAAISSTASTHGTTHLQCGRLRASSNAMRATAIPTVATTTARGSTPRPPAKQPRRAPQRCRRPSRPGGGAGHAASRSLPAPRAKHAS